MKKKISITINEKTLKDIDSIIDNIYIRNRSQAIELLVNNALGENRVAVILSGGPEEEILIDKKDYRITVKIDETTLIEHTLEKLKSNGFKTIFIVARKAVLNTVFSLVQNGSRFGVSIEYIEEQSSRGTLDTLRHVRGKVKTNFLVLYGDILFKDLDLDELWTEHLKRNGLATLLLTTTPDPSKKGVVKVEGSKIKEFIQKPAESRIYLGFSSIFVAQPEILEYSEQSLEKELFPKLAKRNLLNGYLSTTNIIKIKSFDDIKKAKDL